MDSLLATEVEGAEMRAWAKRIAEVFLCGWVSLAQAATIASVSPLGEVASVRQVVVKFSTAVVAFGDPTLADLVALTCEGSTPAGSGRWSSDRWWLYDFEQPLPPGTDCTSVPRAGWQPSDGPLTGIQRFAFQTGGPAVVSIHPYAGSTVAEDRVFLLRLSGAAPEPSVAANAWCEVEGIGKRIGTRTVGGDARTALLAARGITDAARIAQTLALACQRPVLTDTPIRLVWGQGIAATAHPKVVTRAPQRFDYTVRAAFNAEFGCVREPAPCAGAAADAELLGPGRARTGRRRSLATREWRRSDRAHARCRDPAIRNHRIE